MLTIDFSVKMLLSNLYADDVIEHLHEITDQLFAELYIIKE